MSNLQVAVFDNLCHFQSSWNF